MPTLHIDPALCRLWSGQPRPGAALTPVVCADLIDSIRAQGRQEFPAIVRPLAADDTHRFEIICGARRHLAVTHLCAEGLDVAFLVEPRDLSDEDAFRLADLENRSRADITDHARACGYADALDRFYGGVQKDMAAHLGVSAPWLNRHLQLAALPCPPHLSPPSPTPVTSANTTPAGSHGCWPIPRTCPRSRTRQHRWLPSVAGVRPCPPRPCCAV
ncbi:MAG: ParB/RepB/Spo0J family partition protein [Pseudomonadota bacterium]